MATFLGIEAQAWAAIAALASSVSAWAAYQAATAQRRISDAEVIERLNSKKDFHDQQLMNASEEAWKGAVTAWINHIELTAHIYNDKLIGKSARRFIEPILVEWLNAISMNEDAMKVLQETISGPTTYEEIQKFTRAHKGRISKLLGS